MKNRLFFGVLAIVLAVVLSAPAMAQLTQYDQNFECLDAGAPDALSADGWLVFGNVFTGAGGFIFGYGPFPAPNGGEGFSAIAVGEGGVRQDLQQLSVYNDYNNFDAHSVGNLVEANVFQEQIIGAEDVGSTWLFTFDAKRGNIDGATTAKAFIKTLDPDFFFLTNFITIDMTGVPDNWNSYLVSILIDPSIEGNILQFGFLSTATDFEGSGIFYDNVGFTNLLNQCDDDENDECADDDEGSDAFGDVDAIGVGNDGYLDLSQGEFGADDDDSVDSDSDSGSDEPTNRRGRRDLQLERSGR